MAAATTKQTEVEGAAVLPSPVADEPEENKIVAVPRLRAVAGRSTMVRGLEYLSCGLAWVTITVAFLQSVGLIFCILIQVFYRYVLNAPLSWTDETAIFLFAWSTLLLASVAVRERIHVRFSVIVNALPTRVADVIDRATMAAIAGFGVALIYFSGEMIDLVWGNLSPATHYPLQALYIAVPVQGALMAVHALANTFIGPFAAYREGGQ